MKILLASLCMFWPISSAQFCEPDVETRMGVSFQNLTAPHHAHAFEMAVFYPGQGGHKVMMGENGVFFGVAIRDGAELLPGKHPLILLSHGWGGNFKRMGWLSKGLVDRGAIVVAVNHPNSMTGDVTNLHAFDHWTRAQDLSAALDSVLANPEFAGHIDQSRIYVTGFSYGGWTALSLAGLRGNLEGTEQFCAAKLSNCDQMLNASGVKLADIDRGKWEASYKDARISAVAVVDPGLTYGLSKSDTVGLDVPVMLVGLGTGADRLLATDTSATGSNLEALLPSARVEHIVPATHFTALGPCKPAGASILEEEKDDPVCTDPAGTDRAAVNAKIVDLLAEQFHLGQ